MGFCLVPIEPVATSNIITHVKLSSIDWQIRQTERQYMYIGKAGRHSDRSRTMKQ